MRRQSRRRNFQPQPEVLESRIALSAQIGVNLNFNTIWNDDPIWTDLRNLATNWTPLSGTSLALSTDGYPLANASVKFATINYPDGTYGFSYTGAGTVTFGDVGELAGPVTVSGGVTSGTVTVNHSTGDGDYLTMQLTGVNSTNPMDNFHLMMPGYGNGTQPEPMFTPAFIQALKPFSDIRFMDFEGTNNSTLSNWTNRVTPTSFLTDGPAGVPFEDMIELCNVTQEDMWINIPALATPQFTQSLAQLIYTDLDPNLNVYVEYSNETWNTVFTADSQVLSAAKTNPLVTHSSNTVQMVAQQSAYEEVSDAQIFEQVFGSDGARVRPIMAGWATNPSYLQYALQFIQQTYGNPSQFIYADALAMYFGMPSRDNVAGLTLNQLFADISQYMTATLVPAMQSNAATTKQYGLSMVAYEGGNGLVPGPNDLNYAVMAAAQNDPRMYQAYTTLFTDWAQAGGGLFNQYTLTGAGSQYGFWGALPNVTQTDSQEYDAILSEIETPGDANVDGIVDYSDFQTLEADYGETGQFWKQGDFNDDGIVNWQDLNIFRQNLEPAGFTPSEFAQQALFGQPSTIIAGQSLEYDGYGETSATSLPTAVLTGTVKLNANSQGGAITLGGATYPQGLGALANSSISLTLNGAYTELDSTIGVDGSSNTGSSVIFDVYGDGRLLYQSPTQTYASGAVPIDVNVAGVTTLTLSISAAPGSNPATDHGAWADARLVSTANFGSTQPYALTWQLAQNGTIQSTQSADSFVFGALSGSYTLTLNVTDAQGDFATASTNVTVVPAVASASLGVLATDTGTEGDWIGTYGSQGYEVIGGPSSLPSYAKVTPSGQTLYTWASSTSNQQALQVCPGAFGVAACWYRSSSFTVNVNLVDGQSHNLALYALDYGNGGRQEEVQVISVATGVVLEAETISSFADGIYLPFTVTGDVEIVVTRLAGPNAVLSGLFFDPASSLTRASTANFSARNVTTQGNWIGSYGTLGYDMAGDGSSIPSGITVTPGGTNYTWSTSTTASQALQNPGGSGRLGAAWYSSSSFSLDVDVANGQLYNIELYLLDYDAKGRSEQIQITNAASGAVLSTQSVSNFSSGVYLNWTISGNVVIKVINTGPVNAVVSGLFFDPATSPSPTPVAIPLQADVATQGNWIGSYGTLGYDMAGDGSSIPSGITVTTGGANYAWSTVTKATPALQNPGGNGRLAACWYNSSSFSLDVDITNGQSYNIALYLLDYDARGRSEQIQISNAGSGVVLSTQSVSNCSSGVYLNWTISGNVVIKVINTGPVNAVVSGLFFDPPLG